MTVKDLIEHLQTLVHDAIAASYLTVREVSVPIEPLSADSREKLEHPTVTLELPV